jgi:3-isopropylmalate dehydrogenase
LEEGAVIRNAVNASLEAGIVTEDIAEGGKAYKTNEVGDWITNFIKSQD